MEDGWKEFGVPQTQAVNMNTHFNCIYTKTKCVSAFGHAEKGWWSLKKSTGQFSVDEICLAAVKRCHLPGLPEIDNAWSQHRTSFSVKNLINDTHLFLPQNYALPLLMLKWFSEGWFFFPQAWGEYYHLPGTVRCKKGRLGLELSKNFRGFVKFCLKQSTGLKSPHLV